MSEKLIQSYVLEKFFVSTIWRESSAMAIPALWYYETIVFEWNRETKECGSIINQEDSGSNKNTAIQNHNNICREIVANSPQQATL